MWNETRLSWHFPRMKCNPFDWIWTWVESLNFTYRKVESSSCQLIRIAIMSQASLGCYTPSSWVCVQWHYFIMWNPFRNVIVIHLRWCGEFIGSWWRRHHHKNGRRNWLHRNILPPIAPRGGEQDATVNVEFVEPVMASLRSHTCSIHYVAMRFFCTCTNWMGRSEWERGRRKKAPKSRHPSSVDSRSRSSVYVR